MSNFEAGIFKSSENNQVKSCISQKYPICEEIFQQEYHNQRFCRSIKSRNKRHVVWQTEYRQRKKGLGTQESKEKFQL